MELGGYVATFDPMISPPSVGSPALSLRYSELAFMGRRSSPWRHGAMALWRWPKMTSASSDAFLRTAYRSAVSARHRVIAPAFNLVNMWVHFLLSVIMHLTKYALRAIAFFLSNLGHDVFVSIRLRRLYRAADAADGATARLHACMHRESSGRKEGFIFTHLQQPHAFRCIASYL